LGGIKAQYPAKDQPAVVSSPAKVEIVRPAGGLPKPGANEPAKDGKKWTGITMAPKQSNELTAANAAKKAEPKKEESKGKPAAAAAGGAAAGKAAPTVGEIKRDTNKVFIEKFDGKVQKEPVVLDIGDGAEAVKTGIFVGQCKGPDLSIQIKGKFKNITISNCENIAIVFETCVTTVELIGCKRIQCQALTACGSYIIDKCDRTDLYVADGSLVDQVVVYTCQSTATVVHQSTANGEDQVEHAIPNQILSTFAANEPPTHKEVVPDQE
jgi:ribosomal protein S27E